MSNTALVAHGMRSSPSSTGSEMTLRKVGVNFPKVGGAQIEVADRVCDFLRARYPDKTAANVHADTGVSTKTVEKWLARVSAPGAPHLVVLVTVYGPEFLSALLPHRLAWLDSATREQERSQLRNDIHRLRRRLAPMEEC
jgi:anthranilate phosphoribosyltransferase